MLKSVREIAFSKTKKLHRRNGKVQLRFKRHFYITTCGTLLAITVLAWVQSIHVQAQSEISPTPDETKTVDNSRRLIVVTGAAGEASYGEMFEQWAQSWMSNADQAGIVVSRISENENDSTPHDQLQKAIGEIATDPSVLEAWIVLIGHGTWDGQAARFNLIGPDVSAEELANWLAPREQTTVVINCASSSAPFVTALKKQDCLVIAATNSGDEQNFCRFGRFIVDAIADARNDLDKDEQVSLLEAFIAAGRETAVYYESDKRLATEHSILDDNGDGFGTPFDWYQGTRVIVESKDKTAPDGRRANQVFFSPGVVEQQLTAGERTERDRLELKIEALRQNKTTMDEEAYYQTLEPILLELSRLYFPENQEK